MYTARYRVRTSTTRVSTSASAYNSLARVRVYTFALSQDRARMDVFVRSWDACYRRGWYAYPPIRRRHNDETNCYNNFIYREGKIMYTPRIPLSDACICGGHGLMTTIEFPCSNPLRAFSPHDTYRGGGIPMHMPLLCYLYDAMWGTYTMWCLRGDYLLPFPQCSFLGVR